MPLVSLSLFLVLVAPLTVVIAALVAEAARFAEFVPVSDTGVLYLILTVGVVDLQMYLFERVFHWYHCCIVRNQLLPSGRVAITIFNCLCDLHSWGRQGLGSLRSLLSSSPAARGDILRVFHSSNYFTFAPRNNEVISQLFVQTFVPVIPWSLSTIVKVLGGSITFDSDEVCCCMDRNICNLLSFTYSSWIKSRQFSTTVFITWHNSLLCLVVDELILNNIKTTVLAC